VEKVGRLRAGKRGRFKGEEKGEGLKVGKWEG